MYGTTLVDTHFCDIWHTGMKAMFCHFKNCNYQRQPQDTKRSQWASKPTFLHVLLLFLRFVLAGLDHADHMFVVRIQLVVKMQEVKLWVAGLLCLQHDLHLNPVLSDEAGCLLNASILLYTRRLFQTQMEIYSNSMLARFGYQLPHCILGKTIGASTSPASVVRYECWLLQLSWLWTCQTCHMRHTFLSESSLQTHFPVRLVNSDTISCQARHFTHLSCQVCHFWRPVLPDSSLQIPFPARLITSDALSCQTHHIKLFPVRLVTSGTLSCQTHHFNLSDWSPT